MESSSQRDLNTEITQLIDSVTKDVQMTSGIVTSLREINESIDSMVTVERKLHKNSGILTIILAFALIVVLALGAFGYFSHQDYKEKTEQTIQNLETELQQYRENAA